MKLKTTVLLLLLWAATAQAATYVLGRYALPEGASAGNDSVVLAVTPSTGSWTASTNASWLHLNLESQSGTGSTNVFFSFDANPGATRSGTLIIAGQTLTVTQAGSTYVAASAVTTLVAGMLFADGDAVDGAGNVYFAIANQNAIRKWIAASNTVTTVVSGLLYPTGVAVDSTGNLFICDHDNNAIKEWVAADNSVKNLAYSEAQELAVDGAGDAYFPSNDCIQIWTATNNSVSTFLSGLNGPGNITIDVAGNVYFTSGYGIQEWIAKNNTVITLVPPAPYGFSDLVVDSGGNLYIVGQDAYIDSFAVLKWTAASNTLTILFSSSQGPEYFGVAVDTAGDLYFTDAYNGLVQEIPDAFLDNSPKFEGIAAGQDSLPAVVPATLNLLAPFAPVSDSPWLSISGITNGVVTFSFTQNLGLTRIGHITLLGKTVNVTQTGPSFSLSTTAVLEGPSAGSDSVVLAVVPNIGVWTATTNVPWLHLGPANLAGTGSANIVFSFDANTGVTRSGTITVNGQKLTVTQAASTYVQVGPVAVLVSSGLSGPAGVAVDGAGNVYIADTTNNAIKEWIATNDTVITLVASGLIHPGGLAVDAAGNLYIADTGNSAIKKWTAVNSNVTTLVASGLSNPRGVAVDSAGNVYIADAGNNAVKVWAATNGLVTTLVSSGLASPTGVAVDSAGNVYIAGGLNNAIKKWTLANSNVTSLVSSGLSNPYGVAVDTGGNVYIADTGDGAVKKWLAASNAVTTLVSSGLVDPMGVAVDGAGDIFIADADNNTVKEMPRGFVDPTARLVTADPGTGVLPMVLPVTEDLFAPFTPTSDQAWLTISGISNGVINFSFAANFGSGRTAHLVLLGQAVTIFQSGLTYTLGTTALLMGPAAGSNSIVLGIAPATAAWTATTNAKWLHLSPENQSGTGSTNIYFSCDANLGATRSGTLTIAGQTLAVTQAGSTYVATGVMGVLVSSGLSFPHGVAVGGAGSVYIADTSHSAIKQWTLANSNVTTLVASGINNPYGLAVDTAGNVYIADTFNEAIKEWTATNGLVTTLVSSGLINPTGVAVDSAGNLYIADGPNNAIKKWTLANNNVTTLVSSGLNNPFGVAVDVAGNVYIADTSHNAIKKWTAANSNVTTLVASGLSNPRGVAVDGAGNVYIADTSHSAIKEWTAANGNVTTLVASGLNNPYGVAVDGAGNIYIADSSDQTVNELPYVFVDPAARLEGLAAGNDALPVVLPVTADLLTPFAPTSDQSWLTITGVANGIVSFGFTADPGPARSAHINLLGQTIAVRQGLIGTAPDLNGVHALGNGVIQFFFTNNPAASFTVLSTTNISLPLDKWTEVGPATNTTGDLFQFTSQTTTNDPQRYYIIHSP